MAGNPNKGNRAIPPIPPVSRRAFVGLCATCAVALGGGAALAAAADGKERLRPPGGQDLEALMTSCIRCDRCRSACPRNVIGIAPVEDGLAAARLPFISFTDDGCDFCNRCIEVCPTGALTGFDPATDKIGVARVQADRCLAYNGGCTLCLEKCPYGALTLDLAGRPVVDEGLCNGCGMCEAVCPALVYRSFAGGTRRGIVIEALPEGGSKQ